MRPEHIGGRALACLALLHAAGCERTVLVGKQAPRVDGGDARVEIPDVPADLESGAPGCNLIALTPGVFNPCGYTASMAFSPDGQVFATGTLVEHWPGGTPSAHLWSLSDGVRVRDIGSAQSTCHSLAFSPDGKLLATAKEAETIPPAMGMVSLWDVKTGALVWALPVGIDWVDFKVPSATTVAFSHDGSVLATGAMAGPVELWRVADGSRIRSFESADIVDEVRFSPDDTKLIVAGSGCKATVWDAKTGAKAFTIATRCGYANADFSPDGTQIVATDPSSGEGLFDARTGNVLQRIAGQADASESRVAWLDQDRLVRSEENGRVTLLARDGSGQFVVTRTWKTMDPAGNTLRALSIAVAPDRSRIAVAATTRAQDAATELLQGGFLFLTP